MLARIKLPYPVIRKAILELDDNVLSVDNIRAIAQFVPTAEEVNDACCVLIV
jgi:diaphanous 1